MHPYSDDDIHYALTATEVLHEPDRRIDTFGSTRFDFHMLSELMDCVNQVRVRSGRIEAQRPQILQPEHCRDLFFEGFGEQAEIFAKWIEQHGENLSFLKYGFSFKRSEIKEDLVHEPLEAVKERVLGQENVTGNPLSAVIQGVDDTWEISLLRFTVEMIQKSQGINEFDFRRKGLL